MTIALEGILRCLAEHRVEQHLAIRLRLGQHLLAMSAPVLVALHVVRAPADMCEVLGAESLEVPNHLTAAGAEYALRGQDPIANAN